MRTECVASIDQLRELIPAWTRLAENALEDNLNYEPVPLLALLDNLPYPDWFVVLVWQEDELCGFFPMQGIRYLPLPVKQFSTLFENHFMSCAPLIHKACATECLKAFWTWFNAGSTPRLYFLSEVFEQSAFGQLLLATGSGQVLENVDSQDRAGLTSTTTHFDDYLKRTMSAKSRNTLQRKRRKLSEHGTWRVDYATQDSQHIAHLMKDLAAVELLSWKANAGSAIGLHPPLMSFMETTAVHAAQTDRLLLAVAYIDDTPVAGQYGLVNDKNLLIYKIGSDEAWKAYSVGQLLMLNIVEHVLESTHITRIDSCATTDADMFNRCLADRITYNKYRIASRHWLASGALSLIKALRQLRSKRR